MTNAVHALHERLEEELSESSPYRLISDQTDIYEDLTQARQERGWTQQDAEDEMQMRSERHLSKIEPARFPDWRSRRYLRLPIKLAINATGWLMMNTYDRVLVMMDRDEYERLAAGRRPPRPDVGASVKTRYRERARQARMEAERFLALAARYDGMADEKERAEVMKEAA